jgi:hypothetical protein
MKVVMQRDWLERLDGRASGQREFLSGGDLTRPDLGGRQLHPPDCSSSTARAPMSLRQKPSGHTILSTAA